VQGWCAAANDLHLYVVMSNASGANPLAAYYRQPGVATPIPLWAGTPYENWRAVMPYLGELPPDRGALVEWISTQPDADWGWIGASSLPLEVVAEHLRSLTQVRLPDGQHVFFRFWDGRQFLPILRLLAEAAGELLPVFDRYWINGVALETCPAALPPVRSSPWWDVPPALLDRLSAQNAQPALDNLLQWLREDHAPLYFAYPEHNLRVKVERFLRNAASSADLGERLKAHLEQGLLP
jgi:hypothetical protein